MSATVTRMPTRAEMRARRSQAKHAERLASAPTPQAKVMAAADQLRSVLGQVSEADACRFADQAAQLLTQITADASSQVRRRSRYVA